MKQVLWLSSFLLLAAASVVGALWASTTLAYPEIFPGSPSQRLAPPESFLLAGSLLAIGWSLLWACLLLPASILGQSLHRLGVGGGSFAVSVFAVMIGPPLIALPLVQNIASAAMGMNPFENVEAAKRVVAEMATGASFMYDLDRCAVGDGICRIVASDSAEVTGSRISQEWLWLWAGLSLLMLTLSFSVGRVASFVASKASLPRAMPVMRPPSAKMIVICALGAVGGLVLGFSVEAVSSGGEDLPDWLAQSAEWSNYYGGFVVPSPPLWAALGAAVAVAITWLRKSANS